MKKLSLGRKTFLIINAVVLFGLALLCLLPLINVLSVSLSSKNAAAAGLVKLWPVEFTIASYRYALSKSEFIVAMGVSVKRLFIGVIVNMLLTILIAYPLSKNKSGFKARSFYTWFFLITILFNGGLIPTYMAVNTYRLIDTIWALVLPMAVPVFHVVILMNFFRELPKELEEAAFLDGAGHWDILWRVYVPLSKPALATLILFSAVFHWNSWFDGILYMNRPAHYPLQSYLQTVIINRDLTSLASGSLQDLALISERTTKASQVFIGAIPILLVYPFLQPYFVKGMVLGSVKG